MIEIDGGKDYKKIMSVLILEMFFRDIFGFRFTYSYSFFLGARRVLEKELIRIISELWN